jgi:hypothetical protein
MMLSCENFVNLLAASSGGVQTACQEVLNEWMPEEPPVTILFAALGDRIAEDFYNAGIDTNRRVFSLIELAMESGNQRLVTSVATGLIEALVTRAMQNKILWSQMALLLGPRSLHHAKAWLGY